MILPDFPVRFLQLFTWVNNIIETAFQEKLEYPHPAARRQLQSPSMCEYDRRLENYVGNKILLVITLREVVLIGNKKMP